jgi:diaminopimelate epimerase
VPSATLKPATRTGSRLSLPRRSPVRFFRAEACRNSFLVVLGDAAEVEDAARQVAKQSDRWDFDTVLALGQVRGEGVLMRVLEQDGSESTMCGNGARAVARLLDCLGMKRRVLLKDGTELAIERTDDGLYSVPMGPVLSPGDYLPTAPGVWPRFRLYHACGEPHAVVNFPDVRTVNLVAWGLATVPHANCTIVSRTRNGDVLARTFERGVNRETFSCGTGATSAAQMLLDLDAERGTVHAGPQVVNVRMKGGNLRIRVVPGQGSFLEGPARVLAAL